MARIDWKREGDDYTFDLRNGIVVFLNRLSEESSGLFGEMTVRYMNSNDGGLIHSSRVNLMATQTRSSVAKLCATRFTSMSAAEWQDAIEHVCFVTKEKYREGEPIIDLAAVPKREGTRYLLEPYIELGGSATILFGDGDSGKTNLAIAMAVVCASGRNLLGRLHGPPVKVLILDWEDDEVTHAERMQAICRGVDLPVPQVYYRRMTASMREAVEVVRRDVDRYKIGLVVIDSIGLAKGGEPESADASLRLFAAARSLKVPLLMIDHVSKGDMNNGDGKKRPYGSIYTRNSARQAWYVEKAPGPDPFIINVSLSHTKMNHGVRMEPLAYELTFHNDSDGNSEAIDLKKIKAASVEEFRGKMSIPQQILYHLEQASKEGLMLTNVQLAERMADSKLDSIKSATSRMTRDGKVVRFPVEGRQGEYQYGRAARNQGLA